MIIDKTKHAKVLGEAATTLHGEVALRIDGSVEDGTYKGVEVCDQWVIREWQAITQTQRDKRLSDPAILNPVIDNLTIPDSALPPLADFASEANTIIDSTTGVARNRHITTTEGQDAIYQKKQKQAQSYKDAGYPANNNPYPFIKAEAAARNITPKTAADLILAKAAEWEITGANIEQQRQKGKVAIDDGVTANDFDAIARAKADAVDALDLI